MDRKNYRVKRLYKEDIPVIKNMYSECEKLHSATFSDEFIWQVLIEGNFWGVYSGDEILAVTYTAPFESHCFDNTLSEWELSDLLGNVCNNSIVCGYIGGIKDNPDVNRAIYWLWILEALQSEKRRLIFYTPVKFHTDFYSLFSSGFCLCGLRGLDGLVAHYIFSKKAELTAFSSGIVPDCSVAIGDTKQISKLCEKGYVGYGIENDELLFIKGEYIFD